MPPDHTVSYRYAFVLNATPAGPCVAPLKAGTAVPGVGDEASTRLDLEQSLAAVLVKQI